MTLRIEDKAPHDLATNVDSCSTVFNNVDNQQGGESMQPNKLEQTGHRIYEEIRQMAINYEFKPLERINEVELAAQFQVSRTPIREALNRLVVEDLMTFVPNKGFYCRGFHAAEVVNLSEVRSTLEAQAARLAAQRASDQELAELVTWWDSVVADIQTRPSDELTRDDELFHAHITRLSGNPEFSRMLESINVRIRFVRRIEIEIDSRRAVTFVEHSKIVQALAARDGDQAERLLRDHIAFSAADAVVREGLVRIYMRGTPLLQT